MKISGYPEQGQASQEQIRKTMEISAKKIADMLSYIPREKPIKSTEQCASTKAALESEPLTKEQLDAKYKELITSKSWMPNPDKIFNPSDIESALEYVGAREIPVEQVIIEEGIRRNRAKKMNIALVSEFIGPEASSLSKETRERAINAMTYSPPSLTLIEKEKVIEMHGYINKPVLLNAIEEKQEPSILANLKSKFDDRPILYPATVILLGSVSWLSFEAFIGIVSLFK